MLPSVTLLGRTEPRLYTKPLVTGRKGQCGCGCALTPKTSLGFSCVDFARDVLGINLFAWQRWLLIHAMELRRDGRFRFRTVLVLVARQNGKTTLVEVKNLWKMFVLRVPLVINTAQNLDVSEESWDNGLAMVESIPELAAEMDGDPILRNGKKTLRLLGGSRWKVATASRKGGRGLSGDDVNLDELREHQTWDAWAAVTKTTLAVGKSPGRQVWAYSNAGDAKSIVLNDLQDKGRAAAENPVADSSLGFFEWSAPDRCPIDDESYWPQPNPSMGYEYGLDIEALRAALGTDPEPVFRTECLCQRVDDMTPDWRVIPQALWASREIPRSYPEVPAFAVSASHPDADRYCIAVAGRVGDRLAVQVLPAEDGAGWVIPRLKQLIETYSPCAVVMRDRGPTAALHAETVKAGILSVADGGPLVTPWVKESATAFRLFNDAITKGEPMLLGHFAQPELDAAVKAADRKAAGDGSVWDQPEPELEAVTLAAWGHATRAHLAVASGPFAIWG